MNSIFIRGACAEDVICGCWRGSMATSWLRVLYTNTSVSSVGWPSPTPGATNGTTGISFQGLTPAYDSAGSRFSKANSEDTKWCCSEAQKTLKATLNVFAFQNSIILNKTWPLLSLLQTVFVVAFNHVSLGLYVYTISNIIISNYLKYSILNKI